MSDMACRVKTYPALIVLSVLLALTAAANIVFLIKSESEK